LRDRSCKYDGESVDIQESEVLQDKLSLIDVAELSLFTSDDNATQTDLKCGTIVTQSS
jgi:hypothetical protein